MDRSKQLHNNTGAVCKGFIINSYILSVHADIVTSSLIRTRESTSQKRTEELEERTGGQATGSHRVRVDHHRFHRVREDHHIGSIG